MGNLLEESFNPAFWEPEDPGWDIDELLDLDPSEYTDGGLFTAVSAVAKAEAMLHAKKLELLAALEREKRTADDWEWLADTVAADTNITITRARTELSLAHTLTVRLPRTQRMLAAGHLDIHRARQLERLTLGLTGDECAELEERIYPHAADLTPRRLTALVNRTILVINPDAANVRAHAAKKDRHIRIEPAPDAMSWLNAYLSAEDVHAIYQRVDHLARGLNRTSEPRSMDQLRADVLRDLILGNNNDAGGGVATTVYVTVSAETLLGLNDLPGDLRGYGPLSAERVRELAYTLRARWIGVLVDKEGYPQAMASKGYRFRGKLAEFIRLRDQTCAHPACNQPADKCDLDHINPWPRGKTTAGNGIPECRRHHREEHETGWTIHRNNNNDLTWTYPTGKTITVPQQPLAPATAGEPPF